MPHTDKEKQKIAAANHYLRNKEKMKQKAQDNNKIMRERNRQFVQNYLDTHPCIDCGQNNTIVLEFDHVRGDKQNHISTMVLKAYSLNKIKEEISKCEVRCANCHRIVTYKRRTSKCILNDSNV